MEDLINIPHAADRLISLTQQMAAQQSNPVLEVLGDQVRHLQQEKKYPQPPLDFQQGPWRAFYHCHAVADSDLTEHGHFHLFSRYQNQWLHVAALSMDTEGQPQAWVAVNRWVTDGPWMPAVQLIPYLKTATYQIDGLSVVESWLLTIMQVFTDEIAQLLVLRDESLGQINKNITDPVLLNSREFYTLAIQRIDLLTKLESLYP